MTRTRYVSADVDGNTPNYRRILFATWHYRAHHAYITRLAIPSSQGSPCSGSRDPWLRFIHLGIIRLLKFIKSRRTPWIRRSGERLFMATNKARIVVDPLIIRSERTIERWVGYTPKHPPQV
jgi:hypothetical protein